MAPVGLWVGGWLRSIFFVVVAGFGIQSIDDDADDLSSHRASQSITSIRLILCEYIYVNVWGHAIDDYLGISINYSSNIGHNGI